METEKHELKRLDVCLICTDSAAIVVSLCCESDGKKNLHKTCLSVRVRDEWANERNHHPCIESVVLSYFLAFFF